MSLATSTAAERAELVAACNLLAKYLNMYTEDYHLNTADADLLAEHQVYIDRVKAAVAAIDE